MYKALTREEWLTLYGCVDHAELRYELYLDLVCQAINNHDMERCCDQMGFTLVPVWNK